MAADSPRTSRVRSWDRARAFLRLLGRALLAVAIYPVSCWRLSALYPRYLRAHRCTAAWVRRSTFLLQAGIYLTVGLPLTLFVTGEILIVANDVVNDEDVHARAESDFGSEAANVPMVVPGTPCSQPAPVAADSSDREAFYRYLALRCAPVILQRVAQHPEWDLPTTLEFDGDGDPRNNVVNEKNVDPIPLAVYGELTAETSDSYYLTYSLYHIKDYDHPIRELASDATFHDNDNEGFHIRVAKASGEVVEAETWFHNRFLVYKKEGASAGSEPVHGKLHVENDTHPVVYAQPQGHGVRLAQTGDIAMLSDRTKVLRPAPEGSAPIPVSSTKSLEFGTYRLVDFDEWYRQASPSAVAGGKSPYFDESITVGKNPDGSELAIPRYIAGERKKKWTWVRPKPPWSWDDGWDELPIFVWHFLPSLSFESHLGSAVSHDYLFNRPTQLTFGLTAEELRSRLTLEVSHRGGDKWRRFNHEEVAPEHWEYWQAVRHLFNGYVNHLFQALG